MQTSNPFRRKLAEDQSRVPTLDGGYPQVMADEPGLTNITATTTPQPPLVSPRTSRRSIPPPPPPARSGSNRVSLDVKGGTVVGAAPQLSAPSPSTTDPFESASEASDDEDKEGFEGDGSEDTSIPPLPSIPFSRPTPLNPFRKTDGAVEKRQSFDITKLRFGIGDSVALANDIPKASARQSLDVDAFKRLILTGHVEKGNAEDISARQPLSITAEDAWKDTERTMDGGAVPPSLVEQTPTASLVTDSQKGNSTEYNNSATGAQEGVLEATDFKVVDVNRALDTSPPKVKPPPPRPRIRSANSTSSSPPTISPNPTSSLPLLSPSPIPSVSSVLLDSHSPTREQSPKPEETSSSLSGSSSSLPKKVHPPSPPLSRRDSTRRSVIQPLSPTGIVRSNSLSRPPPPPPARRIQSNSISPSETSRPDSTASSDIHTSGPHESTTFSKTLSPPPPPPRRRKVSAGSGEQETPTREIGILPVPTSKEAHNLPRETGNILLGTNDRREGVPVRLPEEDILADLESLQREVDALKGLVEQQNGARI